MTITNIIQKQRGTYLGPFTKIESYKLYNVTTWSLTLYLNNSTLTKYNGEAWLYLTMECIAHSKGTNKGYTVHGITLRYGPIQSKRPSDELMMTWSWCMTWRLSCRKLKRYLSLSGLLSLNIGLMQLKARRLSCSTRLKSGGLSLMDTSLACLEWLARTTLSCQVVLLGWQLRNWLMLLSLGPEHGSAGLRDSFA
jgi:hypothetical protein